MFQTLCYIVIMLSKHQLPNGLFEEFGWLKGYTEGRPSVQEVTSAMASCN